MNKFVRVAGITVASVLVVAGTVWAQSSGWQAPPFPFPQQNIAVPIDTGNIKQTRGGQIDFSQSSTTYAFQFGENQGFQVANVGLLPFYGNLGFISSAATSSGVVFSDGSYQTVAGKFQNAKLCRVIIQPYVPGTIDYPPTWPIYETIPARDSWLVADCVAYGTSIGMSLDNTARPVQIGCEYPGGIAFGAPTAAGYYDKATLPTNCGWNEPPASGTSAGGGASPRPTCNFKQAQYFPSLCHVP